jgi:sugar phosphate isomerase/epimerase
MPRRDFLKTSSAAAAALALAGSEGLQASEGYGGKRIPFGFQLYSVRKECAQDLPGTLAALAKMGYRGVEFADYFKHDARTLRKMLDDAGLQCCGSHLYLQDMLGKNLSETIEFNLTLGNPSLILRWLGDEYASSLAGYERAADQCGAIADTLKPHGMHVGYHNHDKDFKPLQGQVPWNWFFDHARPEVKVQLDTANAAAGGADPVSCLRRYPGRIASIHAKGFSKAKPGAIIGDDELDWKAIFNICETSGGTQWYIVEYESELYPPLVAAQKTLDTMQRWGKC